jgi:hypothetical protein
MFASVKRNIAKQSKKASIVACSGIKAIKLTTELIPATVRMACLRVNILSPFLKVDSTVSSHLGYRASAAVAHMNKSLEEG